MIEKIDRGITLGSQIGMAFIVGWMASSVWHETANTDQAAVVLPQVEAQAGCEHWRAKVASNLALSSTVVAPSEIPKDCAPPHVDGPAPAPAAKK